MIGNKICCLYSNYSFLEVPWSTLLAMLDLLICVFIVQHIPAPTPGDKNHIIRIVFICCAARIQDARKVFKISELICTLPKTVIDCKISRCSSLYFWQYFQNFHPFGVSDSKFCHENVVNISKVIAILVSIFSSLG